MFSHWTTPSSQLNDYGKKRERNTSSSVRPTGAIAILADRLTAREKAPGPRGMGRVCRPNGLLPRLQQQALGDLGNKLQTLGKGLEKLKQSIKSPTKQMGIRAGLRVCEAMKRWAGKLRQEPCPPRWANWGST